MSRTTYIIIALFTCFTISAFAQNGEYITIRDFESWGSLNLKYKINKKWKIGLEQQFRFNDNSTILDTYFTELSTDYDFTKNIFGGFGARFIRQNDNVGAVQGFENHLRFHFDLGVQHEVNRFNLEYRLRFQTKNELGISRADGDFANNHLRLKVGVGYNIKKWKLDPEFSTEIFSHFQKEEPNGFNKLRFTVGTKYKIENFGKIGVFYRMERELNTTYPKTTNIVGLKYTYTFKNKKKKK